jgi:putative endonuclease
VVPNAPRHRSRVATTPVPPSDWTDPRHRDGWQAEVTAGRWLQARGWRIEAHRWRMGRHDLDLVARRGDLVAFIEVKARRSDRFGSGEEAVGPKKRRVLERVAWSWIIKNGRGGDQYRFDVVVLSGPGPGAQTLTQIEDAWRPGWR